MRLLIALLVGGSIPWSGMASTGWASVPISPSQNEGKQSSVSEPDASAAVRDTFNDFKEALEEQAPETAVKLVSRNTVQWYEQARRLALDSSQVDLGSLPQLDVILIIQLRYLLSREALESMDGDALFRWGVAEGMVKKDTVKGFTLKNIQIDGDVAFATIEKNGQPAPGVAFRFVREDDRWKFDLIDLNKAIEPAFRELREKVGKSKIELSIYLLEKTYNAKIPVEILDGPLE